MNPGANIRRSIIGLVLFLIVAGGIFVRLMGYAGVSLAPASTYDVKALVPTAVNLIPHADVREAGIVVGQVSSIGVVGDDADLSLSIQRRYAPIYRNATVLIRDKSLAGENYVSLDPGSRTASALRQGDVLPLTQAPESTQIDQLLSTFNPTRRRQLQRILDALGIGLGGEGGDHLNQFLDGTSAIATYGLPVTRVLAADRQQVASLINDFGQVASGLATRGQALRTLAHDSRTFSTAVAARDTDLEQTLAAMPPFLKQAQTSLDVVGSFSQDAVPVIDNLHAASDRLLPAMTHMAAATTATRQAVDALGRFAPRGRELLNALNAFSPVAKAFMDPLENVMRQSNPGVGYLSKYANYFGYAVANQAAEAAPYDDQSHLLRGIEMYGGDSVDNLTPAERAAVNSLTQADALEPLVGKTNYNPYPPAASTLLLKPFTGTYPRLQEDPPYTLPSR